MIPIGIVASQTQSPIVEFGSASSVITTDETVGGIPKRVHTINSSTTYNVIKGVGFDSAEDGKLAILLFMIGGGGGGGTPTDRTGGGGGAGGYVFGSIDLDVDSVSRPIVIGSGGRGTSYPSKNGNSTTLETSLGVYYAEGGGLGGQFGADAKDAGSVGCGGGAYHNSEDTGGVGSISSGGTGYDSGSTATGFKAGGGGGTRGSGDSATSTTFGNGGTGVSLGGSMREANVILGGGGGGGNQVYNYQSLGMAGGGSGSACGASEVYFVSENGDINTGGGGGGGSSSLNDSNINSQGGNGGSGVIMISYTY